MKEACTAAGIHRSSRIPSLDGLRAISIAMVLAGHAASGIPALRDRPLLLYTVFNGSRGVNVFFVISGFLITSLLLREDRLTGRISLRQFYIRRAFRILPPFWIFLGTIVLLWKLGAFETRWAHLAVAFTFLRDYIAGDWWTGHSWSLSVEEQFYLLWPAAMVLAGRRRSLWIASGLIVAAPAIRVLSHLFVTGRFGPIEFFMFHMRVDSLMFGCALALVQNSPRLDGFAKRVLNWPGMLLALCFFLFLSGYLNYRFQGYYLLPFGYTFEAITISYLLSYFVRSPDSVGGRLLNSRFLVHVGVISYSLYLWQQLFLTDLLRSRLSNFPVNLIAAFVAAELSWRLVEQPALRLRQRFNGWRSSRSESAAKTVALLPTDSAEIAS